jgi:hypothetical protein
MTGFYESKRDGTVLPALKKRGAVMYLLESADEFNEETGELTEDTSPRKTLVYGLILKQTKMESGLGAEAEMGLAKRTKKEIMVTATGLKEEISPEMTLLINNVEHEIIDVAPFSPGGITVFYTVKAVV